MTDPRLARIRNFCIVAHIDHGKARSRTGCSRSPPTLTPQQTKAQVLTAWTSSAKGSIKSHAIAISTPRATPHYELNLIDTPGHVDFTYEVSRSLAACEGAILVVDASQGIEAQTLSNYFLARDQRLAIVGAINKVDLPAARPDEIALEVEHVAGVPAEHVCRISAKTGLGVPELLEQVIADGPRPSGDPDAPFRALIFDSKYDAYRGVVSLVRVVDGALHAGDRIRFLSSGKEYEVTEVGKLRLKLERVDELHAGQVGYFVAGVKTVADGRVGDTVGAAQAEGLAPLPNSRDRRWCSRDSPIESNSTRAEGAPPGDPRSTTSRRLGRSASGSAAASSAFCTWKSCRSGCGASTRSSLSRPRRAWSSACCSRAARSSSWTTRARCRPPTRSP